MIDQHFAVYKSGDVGFSLDMSYEELVRSLLPVRCARSKPATDKNEVLFKVAIVPIEARAEESDQSMPLQHTIALPGFALVVSMNHTLGDGHTYYKLYNMLSADLDVNELNPVRVTDFEAAKTDVWNNAIIFRPRAGELGMLMITRRFDSDMLAKKKEQDGPDAPLGKRIV